MTSISAVLFACEGREHLIESTVISFNQYVDFKFKQRIVAIDGQINEECLEVFAPDIRVNNWKRAGYIQSIINALNLIDTEFFFWLEEDWEFLQDVDINYLLQILKDNPQLVQIRLSKTGVLNEEEKKYYVDDKVYGSIYGFSANPCLCRTELIKMGFDSLVRDSRDTKLGFENFLSEWFDNQCKICAVLDPINGKQIEHSGYLESTPRQWHMTASLDGNNDTYLSSMGHAPPPSLFQKISILLKLFWSIIKISIHQFWSRQAYDIAFRIVMTTKQYL